MLYNQYVGIKMRYHFYKYNSDKKAGFYGSHPVVFIIKQTE